MKTPKSAKSARKYGVPKAAAPPEGMEDEIDKFHLGRDKISLEPDRDAGSSEDDEEEEAILDIEDEDDDQEEDDDDDDDEDDEEEDDLDADARKGGLLGKMAKQAKKLRSRMQVEGGGSDEDEEDEEEGQKGKKGKRKDELWGSKKHAYYDFDDVEVDSDEDAVALEEEEALRIQREQRAALRPEDFEDDDMEDEEDEEEELTMGEEVGRRKKKSSGSVVVEAVAKEASDPLSSEEMQAVMQAQAPELLALVGELKGGLKELREKVHPLIQQVKSGEFATEKGVSYLEAKNLMLLSYTMHIVFYLMLKAEGKSVKEHPVILRLVELRSFLEKVRPLDRKLQYQIEKLLNAAQRVNSESTASALEDADAINFRPNPSSLVSRLEEGEKGDGIYRAPKIAPTALEGVGMDVPEGTSKSKREVRQAREAQRRAGRSELVRTLAEEVNDAPQLVHDASEDTKSAFSQREARRMEERARQEEELFIRVPLSKQEKKRQKVQGRQVGALAQLADLGDEVADLVATAGKLKGDDEPASAWAPPARKRLDELASELGVAKPKRAGPSGDGDLPKREELGERRAKYRRKADMLATMASMDDGEDDDEDGMGRRRGEDIEDDEVYREAEERGTSRKEQKRQAMEDRAVLPLAEEDADGRRGITRQIEKNRGLTPHRNKLARNPRKKLREKFGKAVIKRKSQVADMKDGSGAYGGEATGIKTSVSKSRRF